MKCSNCGAMNHGMKFCICCASELVPEFVKDAVIVCAGSLEDGSLCGQKIKPNKKFCSCCGTKVNQTKGKTTQICEYCL